MKWFALVLMGLLSLSAFATDMADLVKLTNGNMYAGQVPAGYKSKKVENFVVKGGLATFITATTKEKKKAWKEFVLTGGEYDHVSLAERKRIASNPLKELEVEALLEVSEVYAIYQDGAWYDVFIEANQEVTEAFEQSA